MTRKIGWKTAMMLVLSNMIGTGVFTSLGYQLSDVRNTWSIILLWVLGGALALIGAFTFAELGTHYKKSGGDYVFVSEGMHPFLGYLTAWTSLVVGFSSPVAIAGLAMEAYLSPFQLPYLRYSIVALIILISLFHSFSLKQSSLFQLATTLLKIFFIAFLIGLGIFVEPIKNNAIDFSTSLFNEITQSGFAVSLLYVTYAYTGWNAAAYIVGEIHNPRQNLPKALILGTLGVIVVYVALQLIFLKFATYSQLVNQPEIAIIAAKNIMSPVTVKWLSAGIGIQLIATMSSYIWIGPRIIHSMAKDYSLWKWLSPTNSHGIPVRAIWFQCFLILVLMLSGSLQIVLLYSSFLLQLMGTLAVASYLTKKSKSEDSFKSPWSPFIQYIYVIFSIGFLIFIIVDKPWESFIGLGILSVGAATYFLSNKGRYIP